MSVHSRKMAYQFLTREECATIHAASLEILERTGCRVEAPEALKLLAEAGCAVEGDRVRIPGALVRKALDSAPKQVSLWSRLGRPAMTLKHPNTYYGTGSDCPFTVDVASGERRKSGKSDAANFARLVDGLPQMDFAMSMAIPGAPDERAVFAHEFDAMVRNTTKPVVFTAHGIEDMRCIYDMAVAVKGSADALAREPFLLLYSEPIPPLVHSTMGLEKLIFCTRHGIPVTYPTGAMAGATAPATLAGAIALGNAETLAGLVIHQLARAGAPYVYGGNTSIMDMPTGAFTYAAPEFHVAFSAYGDLGRFYDLPVWGLAGSSDAKTVDAQAGLELGYEMLMAELSGVQLIHDVGYLDSGLCSSAEMVCLGNETVGLVRRVSRGIEVNPDTLALDVVDEVGPGGNFLEMQHTVDHYRKEFWFPRILFRGNVDEWKRQGSRDMRARLNEQAREILAQHEPEPLPPDVSKKLERILAKREQGAE